MAWALTWPDCLFLLHLGGEFPIKINVNGKVLSGHARFLDFALFTPHVLCLAYSLTGLIDLIPGKSLRRYDKVEYEALTIYSQTLLQMKYHVVIYNLM